MAAKTPSGTVEQGKTLHATHVPATVSICSNVPGHEQPVHIQTDGDSQKLVDEFVDSLLEQQNTRVEILNEKYEPVLSKLKEIIIRLKVKLGIEMIVELNDDIGDDEEDNNNNEEKETIPTGSKRKRKSSKNKRNKRTFLDSSAIVDPANNSTNFRCYLGYPE